jgi:hypothetical protein
MDDDAERKALGVDQGVELAPLHLLAGVIPHCVVFTPGFAAPFSVAFSRRPPSAALRCVALIG